MLRQLKTKLIISLVAVVMAVTLLVAVSLAWFSVSTNPEVGDVSFRIVLFHTLQVAVSPDGPWLESVDVSATFADNVCRILQPVSTVDGINWFSATYDSNGNLNDISLFNHSDTLEWGNVDYNGSYVDGDGDPVPPEETAAYVESISHFVYTDIWLKSENPNGCDVYLSVPHSVNESELGGTYGTYVLPKYEKGSDTDVNISAGSETAVRIGFQVFGNGPDASPTSFVIYEPNADKRSDALQKEGAGDYIMAYSYDPYTYSDDYYIKTKPIGYSDDYTVYEFPELYYQSGAEMVGFETGQPLQTDTAYYVRVGTQYVSTTDVVPEEDYSQDRQFVRFRPPTLYQNGEETTPTDLTQTYEYVSGRSAKPIDLQPGQYIVQKKSEWNMDRIHEALQSGTVFRPNSTDVSAFGRFINTREISGHADTAVPVDTLSDDIAGNAVILTLPDDQAVMVRLIIWVEGQDVDCWNDIHTGTFVINLELSGVDTDKY